MQELDIHGVPIPAGAGHQAARPPALRGGWEGGAGAGEAAASGVEGGEGGEGAAGRPPVDEAVDKLDSMMELVLEHLGRRCAAGGCRFLCGAVGQWGMASGLARPLAHMAGEGAGRSVSMWLAGPC